MRNRNILLVSLLILAVAFAAGCAKRQLTKGEMDRADAIAAKIARAEKMGAKDCAPKELAAAHAQLDHARHEAAEHHEEAEKYFAAADQAADVLLSKTIPCWAAKMPTPIPVAAAPPTVTLSASPGTIDKGGCSTLSWSTTGATGASIDRGIGTVGTDGQRQVCPPETITYTISATGEGGTATASATVSVMQPAAMPMLENIYFDFDKSFIRNDAKPVLEKVAAYMKETPGAKLQIEGHCDERGTSEYNIALGQRRADSAKKYLVHLGVDGNRLSTITYGEEKPADPGHNEAAWAKNRRGVFVVR